ncbi:antitoxin [Thermodesulfobacteriota bacterium]
MKESYAELADRIRVQIPDLDRLVKRALLSWSHVKKSSDEQQIYMESVALNLHGFYSGLERIFELIARHIDLFTPEGDMWHYKLLQQMSREVKEVRPAVINKEIIASLDELRRFRHLVRNVYTFNLLPDRIESLITDLVGIWSQVQAELFAFADFLSELSLKTSP